MNTRPIYLLLLVVMAAYPVSKVNGQSWSQVGNYRDYYVSAPPYNNLCSDYLGNVYMSGFLLDTVPPYFGGMFYYVNVAKWNGTRWYPLIGAGNDKSPFFAVVTAMCTDSKGYLYAASYDEVYKWDGREWFNPGAADTSRPLPYVIQYTSEMVADTLDNIYIGGFFTLNPPDTATIQDTFHLARWDGHHWTLLEDSFNIYHLCIDKVHNKLYGAGGYPYSPFAYPAITGVWDGTRFNKLGTVSGFMVAESVESICADNAGNVFAVLGTYPPANYLVKWDGTSWSDLSIYFSNNVNKMCADRHNNIYFAGPFRDTSLVTYDILKYDGSTLSGLGTPFFLQPDTFFSTTHGDTTITSIPIQGFQSICLDTADNVYASLWRGIYRSVIVDTMVYTPADDTLIVYRFGNAFPIDTTILPPPDTTDTITYQNYTHVTGLTQSPQTIKVYPNPVHTLLHVDMNYTSPEPITYKLYSAEGRLLLSGTFTSQNNTIEMSLFPPGSYFMQITDTRQHVMKIQHE